MCSPRLLWPGSAPPQSSSSVKGLEGEATGSYFESGDGSEGTPYIIANEKQLYYFNWLQDLGYFNKDNNNDGVLDTVYFKIKDGVAELDMEGYFLPPAGTSSSPFIGNFDGNGCVISNLTISNDWDDLKATKPGAAEEEGGILKGAEIVGFFGIVGKYETAISYDTSANEAKDLYFDDLTVTSGASQTLAGFIAGYANGKINNCGVHCGQFSFLIGAKGLNSGDSLSKYTLIGDYDATSGNFVWTGQPTSTGGDGGTGNNWGASISMETLNRRINYMVASYTKYDKNYEATNFTISDRFKLYAKYSATGQYYWKDESEAINGTGNLADGTILPLSIDTTKAFTYNGVADAENSFNSTNKKDSSNYYTLRITDFYDNANVTEADAVTKSNSGYFVGGGTIGDNGTINSSNGGYLYTRRQLVSSAMSGAGQESEQGTAYSSSSAIFRYIDTTASSPSEQEMDLTKDKDSGKVTATTPTFQKAVSVINQFNDATEGKRWAHGLRFYGTDNFTSDTTTNRLVVTDGTIQLLGKKYSNYEFVKSGLNFTAKSRGYITTIMSTAMGAKVMFELYKVNRTGCSSTSDCTDEHAIKDENGIVKIDQIYKYTNESGVEAYEYNTNTHSGTLAFDFTKITSATMATSSALYYFEIPIEAGDYVIGKNMKGTSNNTSFITYLDIGASGDDEGESQGETGKIENTNIDFVYEENNALAKITDEGYTPSGVVFSVTGSPTVSKMVYFERQSKGNKDEGTTVYVGVAYFTESGCTITPAGNGKSSNKDPNAAEETT